MFSNDGPQSGLLDGENSPLRSCSLAYLPKAGLVPRNAAGSWNVGGLHFWEFQDSSVRATEAAENSGSRTQLGLRVVPGEAVSDESRLRNLMAEKHPSGPEGPATLRHFFGTAEAVASRSVALGSKLERNRSPARLQMVDFIEKCIFARFRTVPTGRGLLLDADPGLRPPWRTCPGLLSNLPTGEVPLAVSSIAGRLRRWTTKKAEAVAVRSWAVDASAGQCLSAYACISSASRPAILRASWPAYSPGGGDAASTAALESGAP
jgi:hypothetical protein